MIETQQAQQQAAINVVESLELVGLQRLSTFELQGREALSSHCSFKSSQLLPCYLGLGGQVPEALGYALQVRCLLRVVSGVCYLIGKGHGPASCDPLATVNAGSAVHFPHLLLARHLPREVLQGSTNVWPGW